MPSRFATPDWFGPECQKVRESHGITRRPVRKDGSVYCVIHGAATPQAVEDVL